MISDETYERILRFSKDREWDRFHTPANLAKAVSVEAGELLECFLWDEAHFDTADVREELADVLVCCVNLLDRLGLDADEILREKMDRNEAKYPVEKAKGNARKYTEL